MSLRLPTFSFQFQTALSAAFQKSLSGGNEALYTSPAQRSFRCVRMLRSIVLSMFNSVLLSRSVKPFQFGKYAKYALVISCTIPSSDGHFWNSFPIDCIPPSFIILFSVLRARPVSLYSLPFSKFSSTQTIWITASLSLPRSTTNRASEQPL